MNKEKNIPTPSGSGMDDRFRISGTTDLFCLLGSPVRHSLSPRMHNESFRLLGIDAVYLCFDVDEAALPDAVKGLVRCGVKGFNLTMPDKNAVIPLLDELSPSARLTGAVNTVVNRNGTLTGYNTDGAGLIRALAERGTSVSGQDITILGSGGAASAIAAQAALDGAASIKIFLRSSSRYFERTERLASALSRETGCHLSLHDLQDKNDLRQAVSASSVLIQATSVGMAPDTEACLIPGSSWLQAGLTVADVIYHPKEPRLLSMAKEAGCTICPGLDMLLFQGSEAFHLWTGKEMPAEKIRRILF